MQKTRKQPETSTFALPSRPRYNQGIPVPEIVTIDVLGALLDEDLINQLRSLEEDRNRAFENRIDTRPWEEEIAYVRREQQLRRTRRDAHADFVRREQDDFNRTEATLTHGDFDNSTFVYAASGGRPRWN